MSLSQHDEDGSNDINIGGQPQYIKSRNEDSERDTAGDVDYSEDFQEEEKKYSSWFSKQTYYMTIINVCVIGVIILFASCLICWCCKLRAKWKSKEERERIQKSSISITDRDKNNNNNNQNIYDMNNNKAEINRDVSDNEHYLKIDDDDEYLRNTSNDDEEAPLIDNGEGNHIYRYKSFDLLHDI